MSSRRLEASPEVKICGVTRVEDAVLAVELGATLLGLNFWPRSPRYLETSRAREIADAVRGRVPLVGVFVDASRAEVEAVDGAVGLDLLQFHGDEDPAFVASFGRRAIRVFRLDGPPDPESFAPYPGVWGFLFDVRHPAYGGTGVPWDYATLGSLGTERPYLVAGGIGPDTARRALADSGALGIDVCSGVESAPGIKDRDRLERLFSEVFR